ncbi:hypothetical protein F9U64_00095 [Gracilibacillus oryzae]|uniref:Uncharacterized protein n=1 Tax=Gracilibacillus oryzae TaxID=1672701 RepID=A0A7C8GVP8_9BACI|nr:hypothetical protein [Gracilibacillus oryzae]KAB8139470.1 hypothetical protein F9U64_00095 [Gracilibacillus oryzae]
MIHANSTTNHAGIKITGDFYDFEKLYESLHTIVGEEGEYYRFDGARLRVLGFCYDLRHAIMGHREVEFVENGMDEDKMKFLSIVGSDKNIYLSCTILWPEALFVMMALNDFVNLYASKQAKGSYRIYSDFRNIWDSSITTVRQFQAAVANCMEETIPIKSINRIFKLMNNDYTWTDDYVTQYLDELNVAFIEMDTEKRLKNISIMAKRIAEKGKGYQQLKEALEQAAREYNCPVSQLRTATEYPEFMDW